jgi:hypothetical protein
MEKMGYLFPFKNNLCKQAFHQHRKAMLHAYSLVLTHKVPVKVISIVFLHAIKYITLIAMCSLSYLCNICALKNIKMGHEKKKKCKVTDRNKFWYTVHSKATIDTKSVLYIF